MNETDYEDIDELYDNCPDCGAVFGGEESVLQRCSACGWKYGDNLGNDLTEWEDEFDDEYHCSCPYCHCTNVVVGGAKCSQCIEGAHQG